MIGQKEKGVAIATPFGFFSDFPNRYRAGDGCGVGIILAKFFLNHSFIFAREVFPGGRSVQA
jgi:hypothetical protein